MLRFSSLDELPKAGFERCALTCGVFDGVHRGHQQILERLHVLASAASAEPVAVTFWPHPRQIVQSASAPSLLLALEHRLDCLEDAGVAATVALQFDQQMAALAPAEFVGQVLHAEGLSLAAIVVGENWRFGAKAVGDVALLRQLLPDAQVEGVAELELEGRVVSSTRIRHAVAAGRLDEVSHLLGRPFSVRGQIVRGKGLGRTTLGCPTANLQLSDNLRPPDGIYAGVADIWPPGEDRTKAIRKQAAIYIGHAPSIQVGADLALEVHLFHFDQDIYDWSMEVTFLQRLRKDERFHSVEALRTQIQRDLHNAQRLLTEQLVENA